MSSNKRVIHLGEICKGPTLSKDEIKRLSGAVKSKNKPLKDSVSLFRILSGETRFKILYLLAEIGELCVCDIAEILKTTVSAVSHQLRVLRIEGLVKTKRRKQTIYYSLRDKRLGKFLSIE